MNERNICKNCGCTLPLNNFEICDDCKKNHNLSKFLRNLINYIGDSIYFDDTDFDKIGIDEHIAYEYIWELSKFNIIILHQSNYFINKNLIDEFIKNHYLSKYDDSDKSSVIEIDGKYYEVYEPSKVKITNNRNYKKDILNIVKNIKFVEESSNIPFPQSDDLNRFIFIGQTLLKKDFNKENLKQMNQIGNRIVNFYISTGFYFHVFEKYKKDKKIYYRLSDKGRSIFELDEYQRNLNICKCIFEHEILSRIFLDCLSNNSISKDNIIKIMLQYDLNLNSMVTVKRRAQCISSWMHWIFNLIDCEDKQTKLF